MVPAFHVERSASFTLCTHSVNCTMRVFSITPMRLELTASSGVVGTLHTLPAFEE